jgi:predicted nucleic acid-binding Zn ribbon protein
MKFRVGNNRKNRILGFDSLLPEIVKEFQVENSFLIEQIRSFWPKMVGNTVAVHSLPQRIFKKTLFVTVDHSVYANELIMAKDFILEAISRQIAVNLIKNIKIEIKRINWKMEKKNAQQV